MITRREPAGWRELQDMVSRILSECGMTVETEPRLTTARGQVEVDVYAEESVKGRRYSIICECKHWKARVPQTIVHGFRTVVADIGVNAGYIVGSSGIQSGAVVAADLTNIKLLIWEEFQLEFEETWLDLHFYPGIGRELDPLFTYSEPFLPVWFTELEEEDKARYLALKERYDTFAALMMSFSHYSRMLRQGEGPPRLPIADRLPATSLMMESVPAAVFTADAYGDFYDVVVPFGKKVIAEFRALRDSVVHDGLDLSEDEP